MNEILIALDAKFNKMPLILEKHLLNEKGDVMISITESAQFTVSQWNSIRTKGVALITGFESARRVVKLMKELK